MKKMKKLLMLMAVAVTSFTFTACDDDPWDDSWHDDYYWYDDYNHGGWGWNQGDWNNGSNGSQNDYLLSEAQTLTGDWRGSVMLSELAEDGQSRNNYSFHAEMTFYQAGDKVNSLSGYFPRRWKSSVRSTQRKSTSCPRFCCPPTPFTRVSTSFSPCSQERW